jgi:hypothetical protein
VSDDADDAESAELDHLTSTRLTSRRGRLRRGVPEHTAAAFFFRRSNGAKV